SRVVPPADAEVEAAHGVARLMRRCVDQGLLEGSPQAWLDYFLFVQSAEKNPARAAWSCGHIIMRASEPMNKGDGLIHIGSAADHDSRLQLGLRDLRGLAAAGKLDKAEQLARKLVAKFPGSHIALRDLARVLVLLNRHAESLPIALKALALLPTQAECYAAVEIGLRYCKQPWLSRHLLEMTLRVHPKCSTG